MCYLEVVDLKKLNSFFSNRIFFYQQFIVAFVVISLVLGVIFYLYYFKDSIGLEKDQIFVSALDLNVENGKVEIPHKPMIRFATPVFDNA